MRLLLRAAGLLLGAAGRSALAGNAKYALNLTGIDSGTAYTISVAIGTADSSGSGSSNEYRLIADTGSSNDAVLGSGCCDGASVGYSCSASSTCSSSGSGSAISLSYASATIQGEFMTDKWSSDEFGSVTKTFLVIEEQSSFYRSTYDGITGLAYEALASPSDDPVSSFYEVLVDSSDADNSFGMQLCGIMQALMLDSDTYTLHAGYMTVGGSEGPDGESYYTGTMLYTPITYEAWYVVTVTDIGYDGTSLGLSCDSYNEPEAFIDSGTSNLGFPSDVYNALMEQIKTATLNAIPDFDTSYFSDDSTCCEDYCDPTSNSSALLDLPSIYVTLGMQSGDSSSTTEHFTVEIPPEYYWRPELNGADTDTPCRAIGISETSATVLGDVFMDGLFSFHDRANKKIGLAVADNCPNGVTSTKKIYTANSTDDWCSCFSTTLKEKSSWSTYLPFGSGCFFWLWWMYVVLASVVVVLICIAVLGYWFMSSRKEKKQANGTRGSRVRTASRGSSRNAALIPTDTPAGYHDVTTPMAKRAPSIQTQSTRSRSNSQGSQASRARANSRGSRKKSTDSRSSRRQRKDKQVQLERPKRADPATPVLQTPRQRNQKSQQQFSLMSSPRSPVSDASSIAILSPPIVSAESNQLMRSGAGKPSELRSSSNWRRWGSSYEGEEL